MNPDIRVRMENIIATLLARGEVTVTRNFENKAEYYYFLYDKCFIFEHEWIGLN